MKNILLTTLLLLSFNTLINAQTSKYFPFADSSKWNEDQSTCVGCGSQGSVQSADNGYYYRLTGDTININNLTYHLINYAQTWVETASGNDGGPVYYIDDYNLDTPYVESTIGAIREDSLHRIYYIDLSATQFCNAYFQPYTDLLLYDFSLKPGDTTSVNMYGLPYKATVTGYDSTLIGTSYRRVLLINQGNDQWCEGIGSLNYGLFSTLLFNQGEYGYCSKLDCFSLNNQSLISNGQCDTIPPYSYPYEGIPQLPSQPISFQIFPNPTSDLLYLKFSQTFIPKEITIYNTLGQQMYLPFNAATNNSIDVKNLPAGLYFIKTTDNLTVLTNTFLKL